MPKYRVEVRREDIGNWWGEAADEAEARAKAIEAVALADYKDPGEVPGSLEWYDGDITTNEIVLDDD